VTLAAVPMSGTVGIDVSGVDLRDLTDDSFGQLEALLDLHHVLAVRGQDLAPSDQVAFARRWGPISVHPRLLPIPEAPEVIEVYDPHDAIAATWHQDQTFLASPPRLSILVARRLPAAGGDTMFANQHLAFDRLSPTMQGVVSSLRAVHRREARDEQGTLLTEDEAAHPVAIRHPRSGRLALFVNRDYTVGIEGMARDESRPILEFLWQHASQMGFTCRHRWQPGDVVVWDNWSVLHRVVDDATGDRLLHKVTVGGGGSPH
jgi:taurine dioxygenase